MKNVALHNLGCKVNACELEIMTKKLIEAGYHIVPFDSEADIYIVNTCTVTHIADHKSRQMLRRARSLNPDALIVAAGCYTEIARPEDSEPGRDRDINADKPLFDIAIPNREKERIAEIISGELSRRLPAKQSDAHDQIFLHDQNEHACDTGDNEGSVSSSHARAFIKIQDGCDQFCSYCIIPYARGRIRSVPEDEIIKSASDAAADGHKEIVLTGIHMSSYGLDISRIATADEMKGTDIDPDKVTEGRMDVSPVKGTFPHEYLISLISRLKDIPGIERIRLSSLEPRIITEEFVSALSRMDKVCPHFHLSLQSGCDETLKRMNRHYTTEEYKNAVNLLRHYYDRPAVTTDVIVGFPGETDEEFETTRSFLEEVNLYELHIFPYSRRKGTAADRMPDQISRKVKQERAAVLADLTARQSAAYRDSFRGEGADVLWEDYEKDPEGHIVLTGLTTRYIRAFTDIEKARELGYAPGLISAVIL